MKFLWNINMPLTNRHGGKVNGMTYQDISGTFSIFVELVMIFVNLLPLIVILKWKKFRERTRTDDLVVALNLTYIVSVVIPTPLGHISYFSEKWYGGKKTCYFYQITTTWFRLCCLFIVSLLCIDKAIAVYLYMNRNYTERYEGKIKTLICVLFLVAISLIISCLPVMGLGPTGNAHTRCESWISFVPKNQDEYIYIIIYLTCGFGNFFCAFITNCYMGMNLRKMKKHLYTGNTTGTGGDVRWQIEGTVVLHGVRMIMAVSVLLYLTWFPALILITLQRTGFVISNISILYALLSTSLSGLLNPVLYGLFDHSYRRGYKKLFQSIKSKCCCCCCPRNYHNITVVSEENSVTRAASDTIGLSLDRGRNKLPRSTSTASSTSGFQNAAFHENNINDETGASSSSRYASGIVRHINQDMQTRTADEDTSLLAKSPYFTPSSPFGDPQNDEKHSSSSSLLSSEYETYDEEVEEGASDSDSYEDLDETAMTESTM